MVQFQIENIIYIIKKYHLFNQIFMINKELIKKNKENMKKMRLQNKKNI